MTTPACKPDGAGSPKVSSSEIVRPMYGQRVVLTNDELKYYQCRLYCERINRVMKDLKDGGYILTDLCASIPDEAEIQESVSPAMKREIAMRLDIYCIRSNEKGELPV